MDDFLKTTAAINDESRILILAFLQTNGALCVCHIQEALNMSQSRISRHLKILKEAGFVAVDRQGVWAHYEIKANLSEYQKSILEHIQKLHLDILPLKNTSCSHNK